MPVLRWCWLSSAVVSGKRRGSAGCGRVLLSQSLIDSSVSYPLTEVQLGPFSESFSCGAFVDSGAGMDFTDQDQANQLQLQLVSLPQSIQVRALDDHLLHQIMQKASLIIWSYIIITKTSPFMCFDLPYSC